MSKGGTQHDITEAMLTYGGSFVIALARCFRAADLANQKRLYDAFRDVFDRYVEIERRMTPQADKEREQ